MEFINRQRFSNRIGGKVKELNDSNYLEKQIETIKSRSRHFKNNNKRIDEDQNRFKPYNNYMKSIGISDDIISKKKRSITYVNIDSKFRKIGRAHV